MRIFFLLLAAGALAGLADLTDLGIPVTRGAAPGYVPDRVCANCHPALYRSYQEVGMARSLYRPGAERLAGTGEDFTAAPFYHAPSRQHMQLVRRGEGLVFRRWTLSPAGLPENVFEQAVDWVVGSGRHSRVYLYRTPDGALFQLPLAWYSQERKWGMAPGYDRPDHDGVVRRVRRECLFCHNGYPEVPAGSDGEGRPHTFPAELPEGTGCQRCHGPGAEHVHRASGGIELRSRIRAAIVNPARLPPERRDDVCNQCHLQPAVAVAGVRRAGRADYSFRPGEAQADYQVHVDVEEEAREPGGRFEINHQAWRLRQSRCFQASAGRLSCLTCHDPHRRVAEAERAAHYRAACLSCHTEIACKRPRAAGEAAPADCVSCHMPPRRPRDVVQVVMTDHFIRPHPGAAERAAFLAPRAESEPVLTGIAAVPPLPPAEAEIYRTLPLVRSGVSAPAVEHLAKLLARRPADPVLRQELAGGYLKRRQYGEAERLLAAIRESGPATGRTLEWSGLAADGLGRPAAAEAFLKAALARPGEIDRPEVAARLAQLLLRQGRPGEAAELGRSALAERPNLAAGWLLLGEAQAALGKPEEAAASYRRALTLDPAQPAAARALQRLQDAKRTVPGAASPPPR